jgi:hypothetical protein
VRLSGTAAAFAPLAGGCAGRTPDGIAVTGRRRTARRLWRALREPAGLAQLAAAGAAPADLDVLALLARVVPASGGATAVAFGPLDADGPLPGLVAAQDGRLAARELARDAARAVVDPGNAPLLAVLAGTASARVSGDLAGATRLLARLDAAQGLAPVAAPARPVLPQGPQGA